MYCIAHLSDLHATPVAPAGPVPLLNKRLLGWLSWRAKRSKIYRPQILDSLIEDLQRVAPDQVAVTGDLTNLGLEEEFIAARAWLERLGGPARVTVIPGNHDAYVRISRSVFWERWSDFMQSDPRDPEDPSAVSATSAGRGAAEDDRQVFPTLRVRGPAALVGLSSAVPTAPLLATGSLGSAQLARLEDLLRELAGSPLCRVLMIHHPPVPGMVTARRALTDIEPLHDVLRRTGVDIVLHGHTHRHSIERIDGPGGAIPVVGVPSATNIGHNPAKRARYHLLAIEPATTAGERFRLSLRTRGYDPVSGRFAAESERVL